LNKTVLFVAFILFLSSAIFPQSKMDINNLIDRGGVLYATNDDKPYTGSVFDFYENGQKKLDGRYRNGIKNGKWKWWNEDGGLDSTGSYKNGLMHGKWIYYHKNGNIRGSGNFINGDGGNISEFTGVPLNGRNGVWNFYYENGQKLGNATYKNGVNVGMLTLWYENGQKSEEGTYKDGELIDSKYWDEDGKKRLTPPIKSADEYYSAAQIERNAKNTKASLENLDNLIKHYPEHALAPQAQYLMGDIYMNDLMDFQNAINSYGKVSENFVGTNRAVEAQFMVGYIYANILDDIEQAVSTYQTFLEKFPDHELAPSVKFELENMGKSINDIPALKNIPN